MCACMALYPKQWNQDFCLTPWVKAESLRINNILIVGFHIHCGRLKRQDCQFVQIFMDLNAFYS